nr:MAG TPA: hypothetical protein [Ackermannviridae sp.]
MKFKDVKIGQIVIDKHGNEYKVHNIEYNIGDDNCTPVALLCIKHVKDISIFNHICFTTIGQVFWIYKSKKMARRDGFYEEDVITVKSLKLKG